MALQVLSLTSAQVAGITSAQVAGFQCVQVGAAMVSPTDTASINQGIVDDQQIINSELAVPSAAAVQSGIIFTGDTTDNGVTITNFSATSPTGAPIGAIAAGTQIAGPGIQLGARVLSAASTTITLDRACYKGYTGATFIAPGVRLSGQYDNVGYLQIPNRGVLKLKAGDYVFLDVYGFPYVAPATSVGVSTNTTPWNVA